ncbi:Transposase DDE domain-containing protein [Streptomyces sp. cf386]|nr:Transposase DDE domain-containing protein [Streptomyces sp. cf386]
MDSTVVRAHQHAAGARPLAFTVTAGQAGDVPAFETVMPRTHVPRGDVGRPRTRPLVALTDRACSSRAIRGHLRHRGIRAVIPQPSDQIGHRQRQGRRGGRPSGFDAEAYKQRNTVERCINRLGQWRGLATRTDKLAIACQAALQVMNRPWMSSGNKAPRDWVTGAPETFHAMAVADLPQVPVQPESNDVNRGSGSHPGAATLKRLIACLGPLPAWRLSRAYMTVAFPPPGVRRSISDNEPIATPRS